VVPNAAKIGTFIGGSLNLDDYDKIPCSAKEAADWMREGNYCSIVPEVSGVIVYRLTNGELEFYSEGRWIITRVSVSGIMSFDWFKLVPKKFECVHCSERGRRCNYCAEAERQRQLTNISKPEGRDFSEKALVEKANADQAEFVRNLQKKHEELYQKAVQAKPDRFAAIDALIEEYTTKAAYSQAENRQFNQKYARAIVKILEEKA